jgi:hypothetical protein
MPYRVNTTGQRRTSDRTLLPRIVNVEMGVMGGSGQKMAVC